MRAAAGVGLLGVTIPHGLGRRRARLRQLRARHRNGCTGERDRGRVARRHQFARRRSSSPTQGAIGRRTSGCAHWRPGRPLGRSRCRSPTPGRTLPTSRRRPCRAGTATGSGAGRCGWPTRRWRAIAIVFAATTNPSSTPSPSLARLTGSSRLTRARRDGISGTDGYAGHHAPGARRIAGRARARLHGPRVRHRGRRRSGARAGGSRDSGSRCGRSKAAAWPLPRRRSASARRRSARRSRTRRHASSSASRSRTSRRFSGCWRTRRPSWRRRAF